MAAAGAGQAARPSAYQSVASTHQPRRAAPHSAAAAAAGTSASLSPIAAPVPLARPSSAAPHLGRTDESLTPSQAKDNAFRKNATAKIIAGRKITAQEFRVPSNPTKARSKHKTGYHEATATTDTAVFVAGRTVGAVHSTLPVTHSNTALSQFSGQQILERNVRPVMEAADGARPDTARTFLSVPGGGAAGHSGSNTHTAGQAAGHDFLRTQTVPMLQAPRMTPGVAGVASSALMVMSMAPGERAATVRDARKLKDVAARMTYEGDRNVAKTATRHYFDRLSSPERSDVMAHARRAMDALGDSARHLLPDAPHSPLRDPAGPAGAAIAGGGYVRQPPPLTLPPPAAAASAVASRSATISQRHTRQAAANISPAATPPLATGAAASAAVAAPMPRGAKRRLANTPPASPAAGSGTSPARRAAAAAASSVAAHAVPAAATSPSPPSKRARTQPQADADVAGPAVANARSGSTPPLSPLPSPRSMTLHVSSHFRAPRR